MKSPRRPAQVYGRFESSYSIAQITLELARALVAEHKFKPVSVWSTDNIGVEGERCKYGLYRGLVSGAYVRIDDRYQSVAFGFGHPDGRVSWLMQHDVRIWGLLCEGTFLPPDWTANAGRMSGLWAPSRFVAACYKARGVNADIRVFPHGVSPVYRPIEAMTRASQPFRFVHVAHSAFHERKGTRELIDAFQHEFDEDPAVELLVIGGWSNALPWPEPEPSDHALGTDTLVAPNIRQWILDEPLGPERMALLLNRSHVLVAPSRAEGFGLLPCEARACGIPVVLTNVTGHMDHFREHVDIEVPVTRDAGLIPVDGARPPKWSQPTQSVGAAGIDRVGLQSALRSAYEDWEAHRARLQVSLQAQPVLRTGPAMAAVARWAAGVKGQEQLWSVW